MELIDYLTQGSYPTIEEANQAFLLRGLKPETNKAATSAFNWWLPNINVRGPEIRGPNIDLAREMPELPKIGEIPTPSVGMPDLNLGGLPAPQLPSVGGRLPDIPTPKLPNIDLGGTAGNFPSIGMPSLPNVGLPSVSLPGVDLPKVNLGNYADLPTGGIGYNNGQITYNPSPTDIANLTKAIGGGMQQSALPGLQNVGSVLSNVGGTAGNVISGVGSALAPIAGFVGAVNLLNSIMPIIAPETMSLEGYGSLSRPEIARLYDLGLKQRFKEATNVFGNSNMGGMDYSLANLIQKPKENVTDIIAQMKNVIGQMRGG